MSKLGRNDPCSCGSGKKYKHCCLGKEPRVVAAPSPVPHWHRPLPNGPETGEFDDDPFPPELEEMWPSDPADTPLDRAYDLAAEAWEVRGAERIALARQALEESPDCIDAYNLLASEAPTPDKAIPLYEQALVTAKRVLGPGWDDPNPKREWIDEPDIESALDARLGLGRALVQLGRAEEAIAEFRAVLTFDPEDYDGVRYDLLDALLEADRDDEALVLLDEYPETISSRWSYARALLRYRREGDTLWTRRVLVDALGFNADVVPYLLDGVTPNEPSPLSDLLRGDSDARDTGRNLFDAWHRTPGAIEWLKGIYEAGPKAHPDAGPRGDGPILCVTASDAVGYIHCPRCEVKTKPRKREVVVLVEPDELISARVACRHCESCDILSFLTNDLNKGFKSVVQTHGSNRARRDFVPLGIVDPNDTTEHPSGAAEAAWLEDHVLRWRDEVSAQPELDKLLAGYGLDDEDLFDQSEPAGVIDVPFSVDQR